MNAQHVEELIDLEALGALTSEESEFVRVHAAGCPRCRASLAQAEEVAARLALAVPLHRAPARLRARVMADVSTPSVAQAAPAVPAGRAEPRRLSAIVRFNRRWGAIAAVLFAVPLAGLLAWALMLQNQVNDLKQQNQQIQELQRDLVLLAPGIRARFMPTQDAGEAAGSIVWNPDEGKCSVTVAGLARSDPPTSYHVFYQGWRGVEDAGVLDPDEAGRASLVFDASRWRGDVYHVWVSALRENGESVTLLQASLRRE
jgi:hypothetical protein